jgi:PAS domain S-box-containing protein
LPFPPESNILASVFLEKKRPHSLFSPRPLPVLSGRKPKEAILRDANDPGFPSESDLIPAEQGFQETLSRYANLLDSVEAGIAVKDPAGVYRLANPVFAAALGRRKEEIIGRTDDDFFAPADLPGMREAERRVLAGEAVPGRRFALPGTDPVDWVRLDRKPLHDTSGAPLGIVVTLRDVTAGEHLYRGLFWENPAMSWFVSPETGDILEANPAASRFYGYPPETLRRMKVWDINQLPEATVRARMAEVKRSACMFEPFPHRLADGTVREMAIFSSPVVFRGRNCLYSIIVDITEHKAAERSLAERERMYRLLAEHGHDVVWRMDDAFVCAWVSPSVERLLGYSPQELIGKSWEFLFAPDQRDDAKAAIDGWREKERRGQADAKSRKWTFTLRRKDGVPVWVEITTTPLREADGTFDGFVGTMRDVTEAKRADELIRVSEERFHSFMIHFPGVAFIKEADGRYIWANRSPAGDETIPPESLVGRTDKDIFPPIFADPYGKTDRKVRETGLRVQTVAAAPGRDRDRYQVISKFPIGSERPVARIGGMAIDITELVETREQLRTALQEKELLLREVHHRVKNNLAVINSLLALQARRSAQPEVRSALEQSASRISAMALIHENLYRGDRLGAVDFRGYAEGLGRSLLENFSLVAGPVRLTVESRHVVLPLEQAVTCGLILNELLMNSLKYAFPSGRGGAIVISARLSDPGHSEPRVEVAVRDDGIGLPEGAEKKDTLGMRIVRLLVERQLRGQWEILPVNGAGFRFHWPAKKVTETEYFRRNEG